jgi:DNA repair protein RadC
MNDKVHEPAAFHPKIKDWPLEERPREKMIQQGSLALTDAELLAIIINAGRGNVTAVDLAKKLLTDHRTLKKVAALTIADLKLYKGIGQAHAVGIAAVFELARRINVEKIDTAPAFTSPADVFARYKPRLRDKTQEEFLVVSLNSSNRILSELTITTGLLNSSLTHPREVFRTAIVERAASVILIHNHPSGNCEPSDEDVRVTRQIVEAGQIIGIPVHDHIIITPDKCTSFAERGLL